MADFCAAHYDASATSVVRKALDEFITARCDAEPEVRKRVDAERDKRAARSGKNVTPLRTGK